ncbi:hypothetical protein AZI85_14115 [Bdellovibrio bacteriovorus]|uniref:Uncharacterized protein n=1 Tax=Bdellovibrio bacteriovorus TaxID=959 RepID=A0A150WUX9_BDEBC|nr:hypothetical protein [Bdellovibrio bacteriovorus]KYG70274.1 hypothetical protein AZI85_14115 [Bdellovibrio bacteriovorus]
MGELEYLEKLLGEEFFSELCNTVGALLGRQASEFTVSVAHLDKSPKVQPQSETYSVELADVLFYFKFQDNQQNLVEERAYIFQVKQDENESGESTERQKSLFLWQKLIRVDQPRAIDPQKPWRDLQNTADIQKSGFWFMFPAKEHVKALQNIFLDAPPLLTHVDGHNQFQPQFGLPEFLSQIIAGSAGRTLQSSDDWTYLIRNILEYKRKYRHKKRFETRDVGFLLGEFKALGLNRIIRNRFAAKLWAWWNHITSFWKPRPTVLIEISVRSPESMKNLALEVKKNLKSAKAQKD